MTGRPVKIRVPVPGVLGMAAVLAVALSCASTKITSTWRDPGYTGQPGKILVHGVGRSPTVRTVFENRMVEQLGKHGVTAMAGHDFLPDSLVINREAIMRVVREKGVDAVFIAGPTTRKDLESLGTGEISYAAGLYEGQVQDYDRFSAFVGGAVYSTGTYAGEAVSAEMVLYDVRSGRRVWSALSRSYIWDSAVDEVSPAVSRIVQMLREERIIP